METFKCVTKSVTALFTWANQQLVLKQGSAVTSTSVVLQSLTGVKAGT